MEILGNSRDAGWMWIPGADKGEISSSGDELECMMAWACGTYFACVDGCCYLLWW